MELREMINITNNLIIDVDLQVEQESSKISENQYYNNYESMNKYDKNEEKEKEREIDIKNNLLNLEDIKIGKNR